MTVNLENCDKIIAEFMEKDYYSILEWNKAYGTSKEPVGCNGVSFVMGNHYSKSLDSLVPVWEKLEYLPPKFERRDDINMWLAYYGFDPDSTTGLAETIQQAAALATAKAVQEIDNGKTEI